MTRKAKKHVQRRKTQKNIFGVRKPVVPPVDITIRPGRNFYLHVNNKWLRQAHLPEDESSYGVSEEIEEQIRSRLLQIIHGLMRTNRMDTLTPHEMALRNFFVAGHYSNYHTDHMKTFRQLFQSFGCMRDARDFMRELGRMITMRIPTLLSMGLTRDLEHPEVNVLSLYPGYLSLPDTSYYNGDAPGKLSTLRGFETLMRRLSEKLEVDGLERIVSVETHAASYMNVALGDSPSMMKGSKLETDYPAIPWDDFYAALGVPDWRKMKFLIGSKSWLEWLNKFVAAPPADWALWFRVQTLLYFAPLLPDSIDTLFFQYFGRRLRGDKEKMTQDNLLFYLAQSLLSVSLTSVYNKCCISYDQRRSARLFAEKIRRSAIHRINEVDWLSAAAKRKTKEKIAAINLIIAESDHGYHYDLPTLSEKDIILNIIELGKAEFARDVYYALHPDLELFVMDAIYEVNAHYYNSDNRLVIPGGITRWPFYDATPGKHLGWCYGGLGAVVGHEMLHAFDEDGKNYNEKGVYKPWWSEHDTAAYMKRARALVRLFSGTKYMGRYLNGKNTLSENIADLGGLAIALDALHRDMAARDYNEEQKKEALREFFTSYAVSWRIKERRQKSLYRLFTDVHAPAEVRVNRIVAHFEDWYTTFSIGPEDPLFIDKKDRISIF